MDSDVKKYKSRLSSRNLVRRSELDPLRGLVLPEGLLRLHRARRRRRRRLLRERIPYRDRSGDRHRRRDIAERAGQLSGFDYWYYYWYERDFLVRDERHGRRCQPRDVVAE